MSILKLAFCPAPFQKPKKKTDNKKTTFPEPPSQHIITDTFIPVFADHSKHSTHHRPSSTSPRSSTSGSPSQPRHAVHECCPQGNCQHSGGSSGSRGSRSTNTSGYQSDYHGQSQSGYITDGEGSFEIQILNRATKERPANLKMSATRDYTPCCNEELAVRKGQRVRVLYRNHDWVFAVTKHGYSGYIPFAYVRPSKKYSGYQSEPEISRMDDAYMSGYDTDATSSPQFTLPLRSPSAHPPRRPEVPKSYAINTGCRRVGSGSPIQTRVDTFDSGYLSAIEGPTYHSSATRHTSTSNSYRPTSHKPSVNNFNCKYIEELVVIHGFEAKEEDEVCVSKGERVKVLNADDPDWLWIMTKFNNEGFIPRSCCTLGNHPSLSGSKDSPRTSRHHMMTDSTHQRRHYSNGYSRQYAQHQHLKMQAKDRFRQLAAIRNQDPVTMNKEDIKRLGTKLIVLMDHEAVAEDELSVEFAETLLADMLSQTGCERIWAYCPRTDQCGYIAMSLVVPPVV